MAPENDHAARRALLHQLCLELDQLHEQAHRRLSQDLDAEVRLEEAARKAKAGPKRPPTRRPWTPFPDVKRKKCFGDR